MVLVGKVWENCSFLDQLADYGHSLGVKITYGDLSFSQAHDPFANIVVPQEVAQAVAGHIDTENLEQTRGSAETSQGGTISPEPLSIVLPSSSNISLSTCPRNTNVIPPAPQTTDLRNVRQHFFIPSSVEMRLLGDGDRVFEPALDPSCSEGALAPGWTSMYLDLLNYGARFDFYPSVNDLLIAVNRAPRQIRPVGWLTITIFIVACRMAEITPLLALFFTMHKTSHSGPLTSFDSTEHCNFLVDKKSDKVVEGC
ncbi:hypothetical protein LIER_26531 [Lithospermum erythrorhizon]|uniref:Transposase (putative) gypsy type domain-containing protein n=1 Tax=Lithospermum erythrorhizon TaxID=34254 RepID=A0AAV3RCC5_LITER